MATKEVHGVMTHAKRIVCLANSRKLGARCVAGREWSDGVAGSWIRPVSARETGEVTLRERQYEGGGDPKLLDVMDVPLLRPRPAGYQSENWLLDPYAPWKRVTRLTASDLAAIVDPVAPLWLDGHSTWHGRNDKIPTDRLDDVRDSLRLVRVPSVTFSVSAPGARWDNPKRQVRARFGNAGAKYGLRVTDPVWERRLLDKRDGTYRTGESYLTISLGEPFEGSVYKLIAAIVPAGRTRS